MLLLFQRLGLIISLKNNLDPRTKVRFLGLEWGLTSKMVCTPMDKRGAYSERILKMLVKRKNSKSAPRGPIDKLEYLVPSCPLGRIRINRMLKGIKNFAKKGKKVPTVEMLKELR